MAVAATINNRYTMGAGGLKCNSVSIVFTGTYSTNGDQLTANQLGLNKIEFILTEQAAGRLVRTNVAANGSTVNFLLYQDNGTATAAALPEVAAGTAFTPTLRALCFGV